MTEPHPTDDRQCISGTRCKGYDPLTKHPAWTDGRCPFCDGCLDYAGRDVRTLLYDWLDLEQQQLPVLSQALNTQPGGRRDPPMPLRGEPEALQREIHHVLTTWETEVRNAAGLPDLPTPPLHGKAVQRAVTVLEPRMRVLASLPPTAVYPTGCEDPPAELAGWEAVHHLQRLRSRARGMLGWTHRSRWVPGDCWTCDGRDADVKDGPLYRAEPRYEEDDCRVYCDRCGQHRSEADYDTYLLSLRWPGAPEPDDDADDSPAAEADIEPVEAAG